ncbi:MAG: conjugative transfer signal peptidase TraF [Acidithiobacillus sp.]
MSLAQGFEAKGASRSSGRRRRWPNVVRAAAILTVAASLGALLFLHPLARLGIFYNETPSEPLGFYEEQPIGHLHDGEIVTFCPDPRWPIVALAKRRGWLAPGPCPGNFAPFIKTVAAVPGQTVILSARGVCVDGRCLPHSAPKARSWLGHTVLPHYPFGHYRMPPGTVWLYGSLSPWSLDSRYYGPVAQSRLRESARPLWTWE